MVNTLCSQVLRVFEFMVPKYNISVKITIFLDFASLITKQNFTSLCNVCYNFINTFKTILF